MDEVELTNYVVQRLSKEDDPEDIIQGICKLKGWSWYQAKRFMLQVQTEKGQAIAKKRFPLLFLLAMGLFIAGLALTGYAIYSLYLAFFTPAGGTPDDLTTYFLPVIEKGKDPLEAMLPAIPSYIKFFIYFWFGPVPALFIGISMLLGSLRGMEKVWAAILFKQS